MLERLGSLLPKTHGVAKPLVVFDTPSADLAVPRIPMAAAIVDHSRSVNLSRHVAAGEDMDGIKVFG